MEVASGVFQFKIPMPVNPAIPDGGLRYTLVYAVKAPQGWVVIDAGLNTDDGFNAFTGFLKEAGINPHDVKLVFITHGHADHAGLANRFKEYTGAPIAIHRLDAADQNPMGRRDPEATRSIMLRYGVPEDEIRQGFLHRPGDHGQVNRSRDINPWQSSAIKVDMVLEGGEELLPGSELWTIWTPGHSAGHLCVHDRRRKVLFTGDHLLPIITPHVTLFPGEEGDPLGAFMKGHQELRKLDAATGFPAHEFTITDLKLRIDQILHHHRERMDEVLGTMRDGPKTAWQVAANIKWNVAPWPELNAWTRRAAMMETLSHLQHMMLQGEIVKQETGQMVTFAKG
ncbi:MAG: MBL fold metallo-hydrolase [Chloroflexi bacterium]|nr:MBL fold metallo-hydrolase [Chloroflexota bacterium]